jgi:hypothetical protein
MSKPRATWERYVENYVRRDARRRNATVVSYASRVSSVDSELSWRLDDRRRESRRRFPSSVSYGVTIIVLMWLGIFGRHRDVRRRDPLRRVRSIATNGVPTLLIVLFAILSRDRDIRRRDAWRRLGNVVSWTSRGSILPLSESCVAVGTMGIATLGVGLT